MKDLRRSGGPFLDLWRRIGCWLDHLPRPDEVSSNGDTGYYQPRQITVLALINGPGNGLVLPKARLVCIVSSPQLELVPDPSHDVACPGPAPEYIYPAPMFPNPQLLNPLTPVMTLSDVQKTSPSEFPTPTDNAWRQERYRQEPACDFPDTRLTNLIFVSTSAPLTKTSEGPLVCILTQPEDAWRHAQQKK